MSDDCRTTFFGMMRAVAVTNPYVDRNAIDMFMSLFDLHTKEPAGVIVTANLTDNEKEIIQSHMSICLRYLAICFFGYSQTPRELLSGLVVFRLEVIPQLLPLVSEDEKREALRALMPILIDKERNMLHCLSLPSFMTAVKRDKADGSHALHAHPWWQGNYNMESKSEIMDNYQLTD